MMIQSYKQSQSDFTRRVRLTGVFSGLMIGVGAVSPPILGTLCEYDGDDDVVIACRRPKQVGPQHARGAAEGKPGALSRSDWMDIRIWMLRLASSSFTPRQA
jgi:hypothetical protein